MSTRSLHGSAVSRAAVLHDIETHQPSRIPSAGRPQPRVCHHVRTQNLQTQSILSWHRFIRELIGSWPLRDRRIFKTHTLDKQQRDKGSAASNRKGVRGGPHNHGCGLAAPLPRVASRAITSKVGAAAAAAGSHRPYSLSSCDPSSASPIPSTHPCTWLLPPPKLGRTAVACATAGFISAGLGGGAEPGRPCADAALCAGAVL